MSYIMLLRKRNVGLVGMSVWLWHYDCIYWYYLLVIRQSTLPTY